MCYYWVYALRIDSAKIRAVLKNEAMMEQRFNDTCAACV
jgi:hypothetical protein